jgi:hypothetical protein
MERMVTVAEKNKDLEKFLQQIVELGYSYEVVVEQGNITKIYVRAPITDGWGDLWYGRVLGSKVVSYIETTYRPRIVAGKFINNYNEERKRV